MFDRFGTGELIVLAVILLIMFGGRKLPQLGRGIGEAIKELKNSFK